MVTTSNKEMVELLREVEIVGEALGSALARTFARSFATNVLLGLHGKTFSLESVSVLEGKLRSQSTHADPPWLDEARARALKSLESGKPKKSNAPEVRARVIRNQLAFALREKNITQAELARKLKKSSAVISRIFKSPEKCRLRTLQEIADALGVDLTDILSAN